VDAASSRLRRRVEPATAIAGTLTQLSSGIGSQREYCERHGLSLKSFGNWRGQLKREDVAGGDARWGRHPRLRHMVSPMATPMANEAADRVPAVVTRTGRRRQFSEEDKRRIVEETCRPGQSLSAVARRYGIDLRLLFRWRRALGVGGSAAPTSFALALPRPGTQRAPDRRHHDGHRKSAGLYCCYQAARSGER
jgi:transposase-like protein